MRNNLLSFALVIITVNFSCCMGNDDSESNPELTHLDDIERIENFKWD